MKELKTVLENNFDSVWQYLFTFWMYKTKPKNMKKVLGRILLHFVLSIHSHQHFEILILILVFPIRSFLFIYAISIVS